VEIFDKKIHGKHQKNAQRPEESIGVTVQTHRIQEIIDDPLP
jgi:hypothetical protein